MEKIILLSNDSNFERSIYACINKDKFDINCPKVDVLNLYTYCCNNNPDIVIIHSSYVNNYYRIFDMLINKGILCLYYSAINELGTLYNVIDNPRFYILNHLNYSSVNEILDIMKRSINYIEKLNKELSTFKEKIEEERLIKRAKLKLMKDGLSEEEAYKYILKKAMDERKSKAEVAKEIL